MKCPRCGLMNPETAMTARKPAASHRALALVDRRGFSSFASAEVASLYSESVV